MSTTVKYKGSTIATVSNETKTLKTAGTYMEGDVELTDSSGGASVISIVDEQDSHGGTIRHINGVSLEGDTVAPEVLYSGYTAHNAQGEAIVGTASGGGAATLQTKSKTYTPTESQQTESVAADSGYDGLDAVNVTVNAISSSYVGSGVSRKASSDLTASGATVTAPAGYYESEASKSVATGTAGTPTATKGTVSNHSVSVTPSVTNVTGYITGSTKTGTAVSVSASELVDGTYSVTGSGTKDVTNYASISVPSGSATAPASISGTSASVSTGTNTLTLTKSVSVTPSVSAGYVSSGTAGNASVSLTASVTTQAAQTIHPSASDQTIAASTYLTGTQTVKAVTISGLEAGNIKSGVTVKVGDSTDDDCVTSVTGTYSGGSSGIGTLLGTLSVGTISTSSTSAADTGKSITVKGIYDYDLLICECSVDTKTNNRHAATTRLVWLTASSDVNTKNGATFATATWNCKLSSTGVATTGSSTTAYGIYANACTVSAGSTGDNGQAVITIYRRYNNTQTGTINGTYTMRVYGVKIYDMIGG